MYRWLPHGIYHGAHLENQLFVLQSLSMYGLPTVTFVMNTKRIHDGF
jgi:hypothetical protein